MNNRYRLYHDEQGDLVVEVRGDPNIYVTAVESRHVVWYYIWSREFTNRLPNVRVSVPTKGEPRVDLGGQPATFSQGVAGILAQMLLVAEDACGWRTLAQAVEEV